VLILFFTNWWKALSSSALAAPARLHNRATVAQLYGTYIYQEALWKYNIEDNVGFQNYRMNYVNHRCCDYLSEDIYIGTAHTSYNLQYMAHIEVILWQGYVYTKNDVSQIDGYHDKV